LAPRCERLCAARHVHPVAEETGLIQPRTHFVLDTALAQCRAWRDADLDVSMAVNLSMRNLLDPNLPDEVAALLSHHGVPSTQLELELTEGSLMMDPPRTLGVLNRLRDMGVGISVDDFGTGYSSLAYLKRLPIDELKIDKTFVSHLDVDENDAISVRSTISLGHALGLRVVAEGIEDQATWDHLVALGCDVGQGFLFARPLPAHEATAYLQQAQASLPLAA
jgi:EAL domain-containing protein (putative c-di-GMP-specific phosphodiesterase class I)